MTTFTLRRRTVVPYVRTPHPEETPLSPEEVAIAQRYHPIVNPGTLADRAQHQQNQQEAA